MIVTMPNKTAPATSGIEIQKCQTWASSMAAILGVGRVGLASRARDAALLLQRLHDPGLELLGHLVDAAALHHHPQLGLEVVGGQARRAIVEVLLDVGAIGVGELTVEVLVQLPEGLVAVGHGKSWSVLRRRSGRYGFFIDPIIGPVSEAVRDGELEQLLLERLSSPV